MVTSDSEGLTTADSLPAVPSVVLDSSFFPKKVINRAKASVNEWLFLQKEIILFPGRVKKNQKLIENRLHDYRLFITTLTYKAHHADSAVWNLYHKINVDTMQMAEKTARRSLRLRTLYQLRDLHSNWIGIVSSQAILLDLITQTTASLEFYDKMLRLKAVRQNRRKKRASEIQIIEEAKQSLIAAMEGVKRAYHESDVKYSSHLADITEAQELWDSELEAIANEENSPTLDVERLVKRIKLLEQIIRASPALALKVRDIEVKLAQITKTHNLLLENGISVIPQQEYNRITGKLYDQVPDLWRTGNKEQLEELLKTLADFLSSYENSVEAEIAFLERRKPGSTKALTLFQSDSVNTLSQISALCKSLVNALDARDRYMRGHSSEVARIAVMIGQKMNWNEVELEYLSLAGYLHDVGKISIPESILSKKDPLTAEDWKIIQLHPYFGAQIIKPIDSLASIVPWVLYHQEKWDGTGYPNQLAKEQIPEGACIIALAEAFTSMIRDLPSRAALSREDAIAIIRDNSGKQFNPRVVEAFLAIPNLFQ